MVRENVVYNRRTPASGFWQILSGSMVKAAEKSREGEKKVAVRFWELMQC
jgi:hypothetical protein